MTTVNRPAPDANAANAPDAATPRRAPTALIGLTGGIASGKSTVANRLRARGAHVIDADAISREITAPGEAALAAITRAFGAEVLHPDGTLNREALGALVFADPGRRKQLELITHPAIMARTGKHLAEAQRAGWAWVVYEAALILESRGKAGFSALAVIVCDPALQKARLIARNGLSPDDADKRIAAQTDNATRRAAADYLIENDADLAHLENEADRLFAAWTERWGPVPPENAGTPST
jgi:dephospho-CoA kinase